MKIYRFHPETGAYLGEDFADEAPPVSESHVLADDATTVVPPEVGRGQLPYFNKRRGYWEIRPNSREVPS